MSDARACWYVAELNDRYWVRSAVAFLWLCRADAIAQLNDLQQRFPDRIYKVTRENAKPI